MEEQLKPFLISILPQAPKKVNLDILKIYYKLFDKKKYIGKDFKLLYNDMEVNYDLSLQSLRYGHNCIKEQEIYKNLIFALINENDNKKRIKLIPLIIYLDNDRVLYNYLHKINYFDDFIFDIKDYFIKTVSEAIVEIKNLEKLSKYDHEREWFEKYKDGLANLNFRKIYSFIEGYERGMGFSFDVYSNFLIFIAHKYFCDDLVNIANSKKDMFEIIYLIDILTLEESLSLARKSNNYLLKFEAIRKAVYFKYNNPTCLNLLKNERKLIGDIVVQISKEKNIWTQFLDYFFEYPLRSIQLFHPISQIIDLIDVENRYLIIEAIKIDGHLDDDGKGALDSLFLNIIDNEIKQYFIMNIFKKWEKYIKEHNEYIGKMLLTNVINIVIAYVYDFLDKDVINKKVDKLLYDLEEIDNKWFKNSQEKNNYFYKQMSKLFVYAFVFDKYNMKEFKDRTENICNSRMSIKKEDTYSEDSSLELFNRYIFKKKI